MPPDPRPLSEEDERMVREFVWRPRGCGVGKTRQRMLMASHDYYRSLAEKRGEEIQRLKGVIQLLGLCQQLIEAFRAKLETEGSHAPGCPEGKP